MRLPAPPLLLVTDRAQARRPLPEVVALALAAGCRWVSVRDKDRSDDEQVALVRMLMPLARRHGATLTLHGEAALAQAAGADGVHLPAGSDPQAARRLLGPGKLVGVSVHTLTDVGALDLEFGPTALNQTRRASLCIEHDLVRKPVSTFQDHARSAADYAIAGPAYETASKPGYGPEIGRLGLAAITAASPIPVLAIGGINPARVAEVLAAGACGVAVMGGVMRAADPGSEVRALLATLQGAAAAHTAR